MLNLSSICSISKCSLCKTDKSKARLGSLIFQDPSQLISLGIRASSLVWVSNYTITFVRLLCFTSLNMCQTGKYDNQKLRILTNIVFHR
jgi:hypothetical protein